jgi:hypothetical protein
LGHTLLCDLDLSTCTGLESVVHHAPSEVSVSTLYKSRGKIPSVFLEGCGVPDNLITYLGSLTGQSFEFYSCFISHSTKDEEFARRLHSRLRDAKLRVWFAPEDMKGGETVIEQIDDAIRLHDKLLLVLSGHSMASDWVTEEVRRARDREKREGVKVLFPIRIVPFEAVLQWSCFDSDTGTDLARAVRAIHIPDFTNWRDHDAFEAAFQSLLEDLRASDAVSEADRGPDSRSSA